MVYIFKAAQLARVCGGKDCWRRNTELVVLENQLLRERQRRVFLEHQDVVQDKVRNLLVVEVFEIVLSSRDAELERLGLCKRKKVSLIQVVGSSTEMLSVREHLFCIDEPVKREHQTKGLVSTNQL